MSFENPNNPPAATSVAFWVRQVAGESQQTLLSRAYDTFSVTYDKNVLTKPGTSTCSQILIVHLVKLTLVVTTLKVNGFFARISSIL